MERCPCGPEGRLQGGTAREAQGAGVPVMALRWSVTPLPTSKVGCQRPPCGRARGRTCPDFPSALQGVPYPALPRGHSLPICLLPPPCGLSACPLWSSRTEQSRGHTLAQWGGPGPPQRRRRGGGGTAQLGGPDQCDQPRGLRPKPPPSPAALPGDPEQGQQGWVQGGRRAGRAGPRQAVSPRGGHTQAGGTEDGT